jgi:hypothetical protein
MITFPGGLAKKVKRSEKLKVKVERDLKAGK